MLGFFCADGSMFINPRGSHYLAFYSADKHILEKVRLVMKSNHKIGFRSARTREQKRCYVLQIGSKFMFKDLLRLGLKVNKSNNIKLPFVPKKYFSDFVRGYFDGDGNVSVTKYYSSDRGRYKRTLLSGFVSGSRRFLVSLKRNLKQSASLKGGTLYFSGRGHRLYYSVNDSRKLYNFMYFNSDPSLCLQRKKVRFESY